MQDAGLPAAKAWRTFRWIMGAGSLRDALRRRQRDGLPIDQDGAWGTPPASCSMKARRPSPARCAPSPFGLQRPHRSFCAGARPRLGSSVHLPARCGAGTGAERSALGCTGARFRPRHLAFHPNGRFVYVIKAGFHRHDVSLGRRARHMTPLQTVTTLPSGFAGPRRARRRDLVHPSGGSSTGQPGHDSIAVFAVSEKDT